jgi:hypothetical protein
MRKQLPAHYRQDGRRSKLKDVPVARTVEACAPNNAMYARHASSGDFQLLGWLEVSRLTGFP